MTGLNYPKAAARDAGRGLDRYNPKGDGKTTTTVEEVERIVLGSDGITCRGCSGAFATTGEEPRARPIHRCPRCRTELEAEAELNALPLTASDDDLVAALETIARCEGQLVTAKRPRRVARLERQLDEVRRELQEKMAGSIWGRAT